MSSLGDANLTEKPGGQLPLVTELQSNLRSEKILNKFLLVLLCRSDLDESCTL
jgi:hypothetical protein